MQANSHKLMEKCYKCLHYNFGEGDAKCLECDTFKFILPRSRSVKFIHMPFEILEDIPELRKASAISLLKSLKLKDATMILQHTLLDASYQEIADEWGMPWSSVKYRIKTAIERLRKLKNR